MARSRISDTKLPLDEAQSHCREIRTKAGLRINAADDIWAIRDSARSVRIDHTVYPATKRLSRSAKRVFEWEVENHTAGTVLRSYRSLLDLLRHETAHLGQPVDTITGESILRYRASLTPETESPLKLIHSLLRRWHDMGLPGLSPTTVKVLDEIIFQHRIRGIPILTMDPILGPFTSIEASTIHATLEEAYREGHIVLEDYLIAAIFPLLGQRPVQYASLKVCDLHWTEATENQPSEYLLNVPRAKQRGAGGREQFKTRRLHRQFGERLVRHVEDITKRFAEKMDEPLRAPLFPARREVQNAPPGWEYHQTGHNMALACRAIYKNFHLKSERTTERLNISPIRFRRTVGTRAAEAGYGELVIAELLDHSDTQSVLAYVEATATIRDRIDQAVAARLAPLVNAFRGSLRLNEADDKSHGDSVARIVDPRFDPELRPMGGCAHHGPCELLAPIECYTCPSYRPWATAPHENVLDHLLNERKRLHDTRAPRVATSLDRTILAVAEVVDLAKSADHLRGHHG